MKKDRILFLLPYPLHKAPSQRFRMEAFFSLLKENNFDIATQCFFNEKSWQMLYKNGSKNEKAIAVGKGYAKRSWVSLFLIHKFDYVVIHREAAPLGPPIFEWIITKVWKKKMIFDFDDAIWIPNVSENNKLASYLKCFWKTKSICKWAYKVSAGNEYLADFARHYNSNVIIVPTSVETVKRYHSLVDQNTTKPTIGWTGSHSTVKYLDGIYPVLERLSHQFDFDFYVICDKPPNFKIKNLKYLIWKEDSEIEDLKKFNVGIMPLLDDEWSEGKCGFKIIQYLALGIPAVASPVGVNKQIIDEGNGFLCTSADEWYNSLYTLLTDKNLRAQLGKKGREKIITHYSIQATAPSFLNLFS